MTIYDIAKLAGVSASTVSRVINGKPGVGAKKRAMITELLHQYGYQPDENARSLVTQTNHTIGILTDDLNARRQIEGIARIENELMNNGYFCFTKYIGTGPNAISEGFAALVKRRVEGALLMGHTFQDHEALSAALERYLPNIPIVLVNHTSCPDRKNSYCVGASEKRGFEVCVQRMAELGRRRLALIVDKNRVSKRAIQHYFESAVQQYPDMAGYVYTDVEPSVAGGQQLGDRLLESVPELDGVICAQDGIAIGVMYALQDRGKRVPEDVSIIGEDNSIQCEACRPQLTSLDTMLSMSTLLSARVLMDVLNGGEPAHKIVLEMDLVERGTL